MPCRPGTRPMPVCSRSQSVAPAPRQARSGSPPAGGLATWVDRRLAGPVNHAAPARAARAL
jgi:hypothetical protein